MSHHIRSQSRPEILGVATLKVAMLERVQSPAPFANIATVIPMAVGVLSEQTPR